MSAQDNEIWAKLERLEAENERLRAVYDALPKCYGMLVSGSGADAVFSHDCGKPATWTDERDDISIPWRFCDQHKPADWPATVEEYRYADAVRALENTKGEAR
jgi:hypothetical protein